MSKLLEVDHLTGGYTHRDVIHDLSFDINRKEIVGLIGLNGAGKSTTIKHVIGLMQARKGEIRINGKTFLDDPSVYRNQMAYIPEQPILYDELTLYEQDRKSTRLNSSHVSISYAVFCFKKKN